MKRTGLTLAACGSCRHPEFMTRRGASLCAADFPAIVGIIRHPEVGLILFDTGYDPAFFAATDRFPERLYRWATPPLITESDTLVARLEALGHRPNDIGAVILSHFHGDHVAGLSRFPNARLFCSRAGLAELRKAGRFTAVRRGLLKGLVPQDAASRATYFEDCSETLLDPAYLPFESGRDLLGDGALVAVELPGHCTGHWGLALKLENDCHALLIGDAAWSIGAVERNVPPPALTTRLLGNTRRYRRTLASLHALSANGSGTVLLPSHCAVAGERFTGAGGDAG